MACFEVLDRGNADDRWNRAHAPEPWLNATATGEAIAAALTPEGAEPPSA